MNTHAALAMLAGFIGTPIVILGAMALLRLLRECRSRRLWGNAPTGVILDQCAASCGAHCGCIEVIHAPGTVVDLNSGERLRYRRDPLNPAALRVFICARDNRRAATVAAADRCLDGLPTHPSTPDEWRRVEDAVNAYWARVSAL